MLSDFADGVPSGLQYLTDTQSFEKTTLRPTTRQCRAFPTLTKLRKVSKEEVRWSAHYRWHYSSRPSRRWEANEMKEVAQACAMLHNMNLEYKDTRNS